MKDKKIGKAILDLRRTFHKKLVRKMRELEICTSEKITENFKRWYLWDFHNVETSRALNEKDLRNAIRNLDLIKKNIAVSSIITKFQGYESERDLVRATDKQVRNITAVGKYQLNLSPESLQKYIEKSLHRKVQLWEITIKEADTCIKRLEEWESKKIMGAKNAH